MKAAGYIDAGRSVPSDLPSVRLPATQDTRCQIVGGSCDMLHSHVMFVLRSTIICFSTGPRQREPCDLFLIGAGYTRSLIFIVCRVPTLDR